MDKIPLKIELLSREYSYLQGRYDLYSKEFKSQYVYTGTYLTLFIGAMGYLVVNSASVKDHHPFILLILSLSYCYAFSGSANLSDSLQQLFLIEGRMSAIERIINKEVGEDIYVFQDKVMVQALAVEKTFLRKFVLNPAHVWAGWNYLFILLLGSVYASLFIVFSEDDYPKLGLGLAIASVLFAFFTTFQWLGLGIANPKMRDDIFLQSGIDISKDKIV